MEVYNMALENDEKGRRRLHTRRDRTVVFQIRITDASKKLGFYWANSCRICGCTSNACKGGYCIRHSNRDADWKRDHSHPDLVEDKFIYRFEEKVKWMAVYHKVIKEGEEGKYRIHTRRDGTDVFQIRINDSTRLSGFQWLSSCRICGCTSKARKGGYCQRHSNRDADWKRDHSHPEVGDISIYRFEEKDKWIAVYRKFVKEGEEGKYRVRIRKNGSVAFQIRIANASGHKEFRWSSSCRICGCTSLPAKGGYCIRHAKRDADWKNDHSHPLWKNDHSHPL